MSHPAAPPGADHATEGRPVAAAAAGPLTPAAVDAVLADFRGWLADLAAGGPPPLPPEPPPVDVAAVVAQFVALRHEVNLQTKATRAAFEQTADALKLAAAPKPAADPDDAVKPLVKALIDVADALAIGLAQADKVRTAVDPLLSELAADPPDVAAGPPRPTLWGRLVGGPPAAFGPVVDRITAAFRARWDRGTAAADAVRKAAAGLADGYALSLKRVDRALEAAGVERVDCVGRPFDPDTMEAVDAVPADGRPSGMVADEVRRGYRWRGRPFRFALVKVTR